MNEPDQLLRDLSDLARLEPAPIVDVRKRILQTTSTVIRPAAIDVLPIAFTGVSVVVAVAVAVLFMPSWEIMFDPWACYFSS